MKNVVNTTQAQRAAQRNILLICDATALDEVGVGLRSVGCSRSRKKDPPAYADGSPWNARRGGQPCRLPNHFLPRQYRPHQLPAVDRRSFIPAVVQIRQPLVVEAQQCHHRGV